MKGLGQRYVQYFNRAYQRSGTLWEGRFRSSIVQQEKYLFLCQRYIEMNPVRAAMVKHPAEYPWSSYRINAQGEQSDLISHHQLYHSLGGTDEQRQGAYRVLFRHQLEPGEIDCIRRATNGNFALGNDRFTEKMRDITGCRVSPGKAGRPRKKSTTR
jgi:putative transposase